MSTTAGTMDWERNWQTNLQEHERLLRDQAARELTGTLRLLQDTERVLEAARLLRNGLIAGELDQRVLELRRDLDRLDAATRLLSSSANGQAPSPDHPAPVEHVASGAAEGKSPQPGPAHEPLLPPANPSPAPARVSTPAGAPPSNGAAATAPRRSAKIWVPRPQEALDAEYTRLSTWLDTLTKPKPGRATLFTLKREGCLLRAAEMERTRYSGDQEPWRALRERFKATARRCYPNDYLIFLSPDVNLIPSEWEAMAEHYGTLHQLDEALADTHAQRLALSSLGGTREAQDAMLSASAALRITELWFTERLPHQREPAIGEIQGHLDGIAGVLGPNWGKPAPPETEAKLAELAEDWASRFHPFRSLVKARAAQIVALERFRSLYSTATFGDAEEDEDRLCEAARDCLRAGVPPTDPRLRNPLVDWRHVLEGEAELTRLAEAVADEFDRQQKEPGEEPVEKSSRLDALPQMLQLWRRAIVDRTRGKKGLIVGGTCREEARQLLQDALELSELRWPDTDPSDSFEHSAREIGRAEIIFLTRFNRKKSKEAIRLCKEQGATLIRLPSGYGLNEVLYRTYEQMFRRESL